MTSSNASDRAVAFGAGVTSWLLAAALLVARFPDVLMEGVSIRAVGLLWLCIFLVPVGWAVHWIVRIYLARIHGYNYRARMVGSGMFRWLD